MPKINVGGTWKTGVAWVNVGGVWKQGLTYTNVSGVWKGEYKTLGTLAYGDKVYIQINTTYHPFVVIGKGNHGLGMTTLLLKDYAGYTTYGKYNTTGAAKYENGALDTAMNTTFYGKIAAAYQALLQTVNISVYTTANGYYTIARKVFALSEAETGCTVAAYAEGTRCLYFDAAADGANTKRNSFYDGGTGKSWWTRTWLSTSSARQVNSSGYLGSQSQTGSTSYHRAAIVVADSQRISETPDANGVYSLVT